MFTNKSHGLIRRFHDPAGGNPDAQFPGCLRRLPFAQSFLVETGFPSERRNRTPKPAGSPSAASRSWTRVKKSTVRSSIGRMMSGRQAEVIVSNAARSARPWFFSVKRKKWSRCCVCAKNALRPAGYAHFKSGPLHGQGNPRRGWPFGFERHQQNLRTRHELNGVRTFRI